MRSIALSMFVCLLAVCTQAAGLKTLHVPADVSGPALTAMIWTPCATPARDLHVGLYNLRGTSACETAGVSLPLVVISHGQGGTYLGHHDLAETLADAGYVVAALNHPGDTFFDMSRNAELSAFVERPTDIKRLIDYVLASSPDSMKIAGDRIGFFGFSRGGYTGIVLAGGEPDFPNANFPCPDEARPICAQLRRREVPVGPFVHDPRIKAYVLADPLNAFSTVASVKGVNKPVQLWRSQYGGDGVLPETITALASILPAKPEFHAVPGAGHFAFLSPCTPELAYEASEICRDAIGFDRVLFHRKMNREVLRFFKKTLRKSH